MAHSNININFLNAYLLVICRSCVSAHCDAVFSVPQVLPITRSNAIFLSTAKLLVAISITASCISDYTSAVSVAFYYGLPYSIYGMPYCNDAKEGVGGITPPKLNRG